MIWLRCIKKASRQLNLEIKMNLWKKTNTMLTLMQTEAALPKVDLTRLAAQFTTSFQE